MNTITPCSCCDARTHARTYRTRSEFPPNGPGAFLLRTQNARPHRQTPCHRRSVDTPCCRWDRPTGCVRQLAPRATPRVCRSRRLLLLRMNCMDRRKQARPNGTRCEIPREEQARTKSYNTFIPKKQTRTVGPDTNIDFAGFLTRLVRLRDSQDRIRWCHRDVVPDAVDRVVRKYGPRHRNIAALLPLFKFIQRGDFFVRDGFGIQHRKEGNLHRVGRLYWRDGRDSRRFQHEGNVGSTLTQQQTLGTDGLLPFGRQAKALAMRVQSWGKVGGWGSLDRRQRRRRGGRRSRGRTPPCSGEPGEGDGGAIELAFVVCWRPRMAFNKKDAA